MLKIINIDELNEFIDSKLNEKYGNSMKELNLYIVKYFMIIKNI